MIHLILRNSRIGFSQYSQSTFPVIFANNQPAWAFSKSDTKHRKKQGRESFHTQHPAPVVLPYSSQQGIGKKRDQDSKNYIELKHTSQTPPVPGRSYFRNIHRCCYR